MQREAKMKKIIGSVLALYPMPLTVTGAMRDGKPNWMLAAHVGIIGHDRITVSCASAHYTNAGIKESGVCSVNLVDRPLLPRADYSGKVSGTKTDKSSLFAWEKAGNGAPLILDSPLSLACSVVDIYNTPGFETFILRIDGTYAEEKILNSSGKIDFEIFK